MIILKVTSHGITTYHDFDYMWQMTDFSRAITQMDPEAIFEIFT